jgi:hypothetical protein
MVERYHDPCAMSADQCIAKCSPAVSSIKQLLHGRVSTMSIHLEALLSPIALPQLPADTIIATAQCSTNHAPVDTVLFEEVEALIGIYIDIYC